MIRSEYFMGFREDEMIETQEKIALLEGISLRRFRNSQDADIMGFDGKEGVSEDECGE